MRHSFQVAYCRRNFSFCATTFNRTIDLTGQEAGNLEALTLDSLFILRNEANSEHQETHKNSARDRL